MPLVVFVFTITSQLRYWIEKFTFQFCVSHKHVWVAVINETVQSLKSSHTDNLMVCLIVVNIPMQLQLMDKHVDVYSKTMATDHSKT